jgi:hypothetical protein
MKDSFVSVRLDRSECLLVKNTNKGGVHTGSILNGRLSGMMSIKKKHNINLSIVLINRNTKQEQGPRAFTELTGTLGYAYSF